MSHKTLISGTAYEISGGKTIVDGTAYSIDKGKTLVDGTVYEVGFGVPVTITLSGTGSSYNCYIEHNGTKYYDATQTPSFDAMIGDTIHCETDESVKNRIYLNGTKVVDGGDSNAEYDYTVISSATITFEKNTPNTNYIRIVES